MFVSTCSQPFWRYGIVQTVLESTLDSHAVVDTLNVLLAMRQYVVCNTIYMQQSSSVYMQNWPVFLFAL